MVMRPLLNAMLFFPSRTVTAPSGLAVEDVFITTEDGERLHGWWVAGRGAPRGHVLFCHGNAGNIASRAGYARALSQAGFDVLLFDYRGYGRSSGRVSEEGTHRDARAALAALLSRSGADPARTLYLGESLGAAVALALALESPPAGLILQSAFTSVRDMARVVMPLLPRAVVPDAYPSLRLIRHLRAPLLVVHGERDDVVPAAQGRALFDAAPGTKRFELLSAAGHNDLLVLAEQAWLAAIVGWSTGLLP